ncbi:MAG: ferritin-like domain-containing protein [Syntrophothermus sp.]
MEKQKAIDILKQAILLEKRGYAFYSTIADQAKDEDIKNVFNVMADEETTHVKFLSEQFAHYDKHHSFLKVSLPDFEEDPLADKILTEKLKDKISAASFEAAAIASAIDFEKRAIEVYSSQAELATDPNEKELYKWLAEWEKTHLKVLSELDNQLKEKVWFDNQFWPF